MTRSAKVTLKEYNRVNNLFEESKHLLNSLKVPYNKNVYLQISNRHHNWGDCVWDPFENKFRIRVSKECLLADDIGVQTTLIHELLHTVDDGMNHTGNWKKWATFINNHTRYNIKRVTSYKEKGVDPSLIKPRTKLPYRFKVICDSCNTSWKYKKECTVVRECSNNTHSCICPKCNSHNFTVVKL